MSKISSNRGVLIISAVLSLVVLAIYGAAIVMLLSTEQFIRILHIEEEQSFYEVQAGLEYAIKEINEGGFPIVENKPIGRGTFTTEINPITHTITAIGMSGKARKTHKITYNNLAEDCMTANNDQATLVGPDKTDLKSIALRKGCLNAVTIDKMQLSWSPDAGQHVTMIEIGNAPVYDDPVGTPSGGIIDISDFTISDDHTYQINLIRFTSSMLGNRLTMKIIYTDTSYSILEFTILPPQH